jgi:hypothetical protein
MLPEQTKRALIVVKTYPVPATKGVEVSCTAAITDAGEWLRLFPISWRFLDDDQKFHKYQWVDVTVTKSKDPRPESYRVKPDGIKIISKPLSTKNAWQAAKAVVVPLRAHCLCCLTKERDINKHPTLGCFRPRSIERLVITKDDATWTESQLAILRQGNLFDEGPKTELEEIPYKFQYKFYCEDEICPGHQIICTDWEMGQSYRKWRMKYGANWETKFRQTYESGMQRKDTHFFVGTMNGHPHVWIIVGLFYPPRVEDTPQQALF